MTGRSVDAKGLCGGNEISGTLFVADIVGIGAGVIKLLSETERLWTGTERLGRLFGAEKVQIGPEMTGTISDVDRLCIGTGTISRPSEEADTGKPDIGELVPRGGPDGVKAVVVEGLRDVPDRAVGLDVPVRLGVSCVVFVACSRDVVTCGTEEAREYGPVKPSVPDNTSDPLSIAVDTGPGEFGETIESRVLVARTLL